MDQTRRAFVATASFVTAGGAAALATLTSADDDDGPATAARKLNILFLGGTGFIGPHIVRDLTKRGHTVTLFNRGNRSELHPGLECIVGNRISSESPGLAPLEEAVNNGRTWDVVIDTANVHRWVEDSARLLATAAGHYVFTSSMSVYADNSKPGQTEADGTLAEMPDEEADTIDRLPYNMQYFGAVKVRSEQAAEKHFPGRTTVIRPGLIVGPRDFSHRFTYWPYRIRQGGNVLAPGAPTDPVMFIDVRDMSAFLVRLIEKRTMGIYNVNGPTSRDMTIGTLLEGCKAATKSDATFTWVPAEFLGEHEIGPWMDMPVWIPPADGMEGFHAKSTAKALAAGLTTRPLADTVVDTLKWLDEDYIPKAREAGGDYQPGVRAPGITREKEAEVLSAWAERSPAG